MQASDKTAVDPENKEDIAQGLEAIENALKKNADDLWAHQAAFLKRAFLATDQLENTRYDTPALMKKYLLAPEGEKTLRGTSERLTGLALLHRGGLASGLTPRHDRRRYLPLRTSKSMRTQRGRSWSCC